MFDKNFKKIEIDDTVLFSCGQWSYEAIVYDIDNNYIYTQQTSEGNGYGHMTFHNKIECSQYISIIDSKKPN